MFVIGEATSDVNRSKLQLPKPYGLGKKGKKTYGVWLNDQVLYLSDETTPLKAKSGKEDGIFVARIDASSRMTVPGYLDGSEAQIVGHITAIKIEFFAKRCGD